MTVSRVFAGVLLLSVTVSASVRAQQQPQQPGDTHPCAGAIPGNIDAGMLTGELLALLRVSDTFRQQCERIAADRRLRVRISITHAVDGGGRAQTVFLRYRPVLLLVHAEILFGADYRELLAHEFEHILEQLDGIDLRHEASAGRAWEVGGGAFETRRASRAGVQALREAEEPQPRSALTAPAMR
jgi:hypothetical protein